MKESPCEFTINKKSITECAATVKAAMTKDGKIKVSKSGKLSGLKMVTIMLNGKKVTLSSKQLKITDADPATGTVKITGKKNFTGTAVVTVTK